MSPGLVIESYGFSAAFTDGKVRGLDGLDGDIAGMRSAVEMIGEGLAKLNALLSRCMILEDPKGLRDRLGRSRRLTPSTTLRLTAIRPPTSLASVSNSRYGSMLLSAESTI
jgi:hypothetical protein